MDLDVRHQPIAFIPMYQGLYSMIKPTKAQDRKRIGQDLGAFQVMLEAKYHICPLNIAKMQNEYRKLDCDLQANPTAFRWINQLSNKKSYQFEARNPLVRMDENGDWHLVQASELIQYIPELKNMQPLDDMKVILIKSIANLTMGQLVTLDDIKIAVNHTCRKDKQKAKKVIKYGLDYLTHYLIDNQTMTNRNQLFKRISGIRPQEQIMKLYVDVEHGITRNIDRDILVALFLNMR